MGFFSRRSPKGKGFCPTLSISNRTDRTVWVCIVDGGEEKSCQKITENEERVDFPKRLMKSAEIVAIKPEGENDPFILDASNYSTCGCDYAVVKTAGEFNLVRLEPEQADAHACPMDRGEGLALVLDHLVSFLMVIVGLKVCSGKLGEGGFDRALTKAGA
jgi:hypothetical protein